MADITIARLIVYPIKSCKGIELASSHCTPDGLEHDRQWMVVDAVSLKACTARQYPRMVLIEPSIEADVLRVRLPAPASSAPAVSSTSGTAAASTSWGLPWPFAGRPQAPAAAPDGGAHAEFTLPLRLSALEESTWEPLDNLDLWSLSLSGLSPPFSHPANVALSTWFGRPVRVVVKHGRPRAPGKKAPGEDETGYGRVTTAYADTYALHLLTLPSLHVLSAALSHTLSSSPPPAPAPAAQAPLPSATTAAAAPLFDPSTDALIARFRPNVVLALSPALTPAPSSASAAAVPADAVEDDADYPEDAWGRLRISNPSSSEDGGDEDGTGSGTWDIAVVGRCGRCTLPNVDPATGTRHASLPYRLLTAVRPKEVDEFVGVPCPTLGVYAVPLLCPPPRALPGTRSYSSSVTPTISPLPWRVGARVKVLSRRTNVDWVALPPAPADAVRPA